MALSKKVALLTCLGFIFGMCWLVSMVARPLVELPTPLIVRGPHASAEQDPPFDARVDSRSATRRTPTVVAGRFARPSPVEVNKRPNRREGETLLVSGSSPPDAGLEVPPLPPLYIPEAPVVAKAGELVDGQTGLPRAASSLETELWIAKATGSDSPGSAAGTSASMLASVRASETLVPAVKKYKVKRGDTLVKIIRQQWNSDDPRLMRVLLTVNPRVAERPDLIFAGEVLRIPDLESAQPAPAVARAELRGNLAAQPRIASREGTDTGGSAGETDVRLYTIRRRDCLASIARRMLNDERRWREIARLNRLRNPHKILPGLQIMLPRVNSDT